MVLSLLGFDGFVTIDRAEPEFTTLKEFYDHYNDLRSLLVIGLGAAIVDYQLGVGGAYAFWNCLKDILKKHNFTIGSLDEAYSVLLEFMSCKVNARLRNTKIRRIHRLFDSGFVKYLWNEAYKYFDIEPMKIWRKLALCMGSDMSSKTISFTMKILDLISLIVNGYYAYFPVDLPIPVDEHIARMSVYSGILMLNPRPKTPTEIGSAALRFRNLIVRGWSEVARGVSSIISKRISIFRIDSLIWQLSKAASSVGYARHRAVEAMKKRLVEIGINEDVALKIASELAHEM